ncbi:MAG: hypothetical protein M3160_04830 [Candidatus Eremiobacteraeota bacterium]|nr:hypothetical protein [Candidatus Eremiobacteraeota bacterium]
MANIREKVIVNCPFSAVIEYVETFFSQRHKLPLSALQTIRTEVTTEYNVAIDRMDSARRHDALEVSWYPKAHLPLPAFHGILSVRPHFKDSELALEGSYEPPLGPVGEVFEATIGRNIARGTINGLLQEIKASVQDQWNRQRLKYPDVETLNKAAKSQHKQSD